MEHKDHDPIVTIVSRGRSSRKQTDTTHINEVPKVNSTRSKSATKHRLDSTQPVHEVTKVGSVEPVIVHPKTLEVTKVKTKRVPKPEPLLIPNPKRFVLFPIVHQDLYDMYKKHLSTEWRPEEVDMSSDIKDWEKMDEGERHFITHILAFFAASDGIVMENLSMRFSTEVQYPEARQYYAVQNKMEAIHCVAPETLILTDTGYHQIVDLVGQHVNIWNGEEFSNVQIVKTSESSPVMRVILSNGMEIQCTHEHKWFVRKGSRAHPERCKIEKCFTKDLKNNDVIASYDLPMINMIDPDEFQNPYTHGFFCGDGQITLYDYKNTVNKDKFVVPINYSTKTKLEWLAGYVDADGYTNSSDTSIQICSINKQFLRDIQLMLTTMGIHSNIHHQADACSEIMYIRASEIHKLVELGFAPHHLVLNVSPNTKSNPQLLTVVSVIDESRVTPTYCFNEPKRHAGTFGGIVTGQSESYSLMIDTLIKEPKEKEHILGAIETIPSIAKKAKWAVKWMEDKEASFAQRLCCFAIVEGIFFSSSFASFFWLKEKGKLKGCTQFNEWISRDESLHTDFACLLYSYIVNRVPKSTIVKIFKEAVAIEKEFITESIPCRLIGMNSELMCQYIEFVADRLVVQLGYSKIFDATNPFAFMERISVDLKGNFFEVRITNYANAVNVGGETKQKISTTADF